MVLKVRTLKATGTGAVLASGVGSSGSGFGAAFPSTSLSGSALTSFVNSSRTCGTVDSSQVTTMRSAPCVNRVVRMVWSFAITSPSSSSPSLARSRMTCSILIPWRRSFRAPSEVSFAWARRIANCRPRFASELSSRVALSAMISFKRGGSISSRAMRSVSSSTNGTSLRSSALLETMNDCTKSSTAARDCTWAAAPMPPVWAATRRAI